MSKKLTITVGVAAAVIITVVAGLLYAVNFYSSAKDYKKVLSVERNSGQKSRKKSDAGAAGKSAKEVSRDHIDLGHGSSGDSLDYRRTDTAEAVDKEFNGANTINILFLGTDRSNDRESMGSFRTDTIILVSINMDTKRVNVLSIPRDTYAYIPLVKKKDKINHAYSLGGMGKKGIESVIEVVEGLIDNCIVDYYFLMDMEPVADIIDNLGGIELDVEIDMKDYGANLSKGKQILNGAKAFEYIHWRFGPDGDIGRVKRQQKFIMAMLTKLKDTNKLTAGVELVLKYSRYLKTSMSNKQLLALAVLGNDISDENISFYSVPGYFGNINKISYWMMDEEKARTLFRQVFE